MTKKSSITIRKHDRIQYQLLLFLCLYIVLSSTTCFVQSTSISFVKKKYNYIPSRRSMTMPMTTYTNNNNNNNNILIHSNIVSYFHHIVQRHRRQQRSNCQSTDTNTNSTTITTTLLLKQQPSLFLSLCSSSLPFKVFQFNNNNNNNATTKVLKIKSTTSTIQHQLRGGSATATATATATIVSSRTREILELLSGGIAGTVAACITNPLEVVKMQLQSSIVTSPITTSTTAISAATTTSTTATPLVITISRKILQTDGIKGFFRGLVPTLIGIIPARSAYFYGYNKCKSALNSVGTEKQYKIHTTVFGKLLCNGAPINSIVSGFFAGVVSNTITNPIWMIKTRITLLVDTSVGQRVYNGYSDVIWSIYKNEGIKGFYKGIYASYWGCTEGAIQFLIYEQIKTKLRQKKRYKQQQIKASSMTTTKVQQKQQQSVVANSNNDNIIIVLSNIELFWSAAVSKMLASIVTYPHEVARTRLREQSKLGIYKYKNMWQSIQLIGVEEGRTGLYGGMYIHLLKVVPNSAFMFVTYEIVKKYLNDYTIVVN